MKNYLKIILFIFCLLFISNTAYAISSELSTELDQQGAQFVTHSGLSYSWSVGDVIASLIMGFLTVLAVIFIILIIVAGFNWMTAGGDEQKVTKAKQMIQRAIIGLVIIVGAYSITYFVFKWVPFGQSTPSF